MFSIIMAMDLDRLEQFKNTKRAYDKMPQKKEFIMPTRNIEELNNYLRKHRLLKDVKLVSYELERGFNVSKALNIGVRKAKYEDIIITSPEVMPLTDVLKQFSECDENIICAVDDQSVAGELSPLVNKQFRSDTPAMYFLARFKKSDIETINGWDEEFLRGYAYEDNDFGDRWKRAGIPFLVREDIKAVHQYHPRKETVPGGTNVNYQTYNQNNARGIVKCLNGLYKL